jgi:hypothetical protein
VCQVPSCVDGAQKETGVDCRSWRLRAGAATSATTARASAAATSAGAELHGVNSTDPATAASLGPAPDRAAR